jgi:hypothetical protein
MTEPERRIAEYRALRDAAWAVVDADLAMLKNDLAARGVGERIKDKVGEEAHEVWDQARDVAGEHKGVVAATILALVAWLLRAPLGDAIAGLLGRNAEQGGGESVEDGKGDQP